MGNTEQQQELGAQALLELTKQKEEKSGNNSNNNTSQDEINFDQHKDVEAEVIRLVGSALHTDDKSHVGNFKKGNSKKRGFSDDDDISQLEFQQWTTGFLGEEENDYNFVQSTTQSTQQQQQQPQSQQAQLTQQQQQSNQQQQSGDHQQSNVQQQGQQQGQQNKPLKKQKKQKNDITVDPELSQLDTNPFDNNDMIDASTLEGLRHIDHEYLRHAAEESQHSNDVSSVDEVQRLAVQAAQVVAAHQAQQEQEQQNRHHHHDEGVDVDQVSGSPQDDQTEAQAVAAAAAAAAAVNSAHKKYPNDDHASHDMDIVDRNSQNKVDGRSNKILADPADAASLIAEAAAKASSWISANMHSKSFSKEEADAIDNFISEYCEINKLSRDDICRRIWANERKKDDFWESIQKVLPLRTRASVYKHVRRTYHIFDVRGRWTKEDDEKLAALATSREGQWKLIGLEMNRMPEDCRDRWRNYVKCGVNRQQNKWSEEEEDNLKLAIFELLKENKSFNSDSYPYNQLSKDNIVTYATANEPLINWTLVSDRLGGSRSRIQCRYKWNKLLKREAVERVSDMSHEDKIWLISKIKEFNFQDSNSIGWDSLVALQNSNSFYTPLDFKMAFEKMKSAYSRDHRKFPYHQLVDLILARLTDSTTGLNEESAHYEQITQEQVPFAQQHSLHAAAAAAAAAAVVSQHTLEDDHIKHKVKFKGIKKEDHSNGNSSNGGIMYAGGNPDRNLPVSSRMT